MFIFSECDSICKAEISELIETKTKMIEAKNKMMEAKYLSEIELIKGKCLSEAKIIELIESKIESAKFGPGKWIDCPIDNPNFRIVDGTCLR